MSQTEEKKPNAFGAFLRDCRAEVGKISWPTRNELIDSTGVVVVLILLVSLFVYVSDSLLAKVMTGLMSIG